MAFAAENTSQADIDEAVRIVRATPANPVAALKSRRTPALAPVFGDALVFLMNDSVLVAMLRRFQKNLRAIIDAHSVKPQERKEDKFWKIQDFFHASFAAKIPPSSAQTYADERAKLDSDTLHAISEEIFAFLNKNPYCTIEEFKINSDGHIVVRPNIEPAHAFFQTRATVTALLKSGAATERHAAVEASNSTSKVTLGCVVGLIDLNGLSDVGKERVRVSIQCFNSMIKGRRFELNTIAWVDWHNKRTCSEHAQMMRVEYTKQSMTAQSFPALLRRGTKYTLPFYKAPLASQHRLMALLAAEKIRYESLGASSPVPASLSDYGSFEVTSSLPFNTVLPQVQSFFASSAGPTAGLLDSRTP